MINVGVVGYGYAGRMFHSYLISRVPDLRLVAVTARSAERRALAEKDRGVATYASIEEMLEKGGVDLVVIATPHNTHAPLAIQAMDAGKHVVTDKVMCMNAAEADAMIAASRRNGVLLSVYHNRRWDWDYLTVKKVLAEGLLGEPFQFESTIHSYRPPRPGGRATWRGDLAVSGGIIYDWGAHLLDHALQLVPSKVASVTCDIQYRLGSETGTHSREILRFENGVVYTIDLSNLARIPKPRWYILGERGALIKTGLDPQEAAIRATWNIEDAVEAPEDRARIVTEVDGLVSEMVIDSVKGDWTSYYRNVADALLDRAELEVKPEQVRRAMVVLDALTLSAKNGGQKVELGI